MPEWGHVSWLGGLLLTPLIWWLHHHDLRRSVGHVAAVFLWPDRRNEAQQNTISSTTDPRWRRRALFCALVSIALAEPHSPAPDAVAREVWLDDSLSMWTQEQGRRRIELAVARLVQDLGKHPGPMTLHSLSHAGRLLVLPAMSPDDLQGRILDWLTPPGDDLVLPHPLQMSVEAEHWLLSDGSTPAIQDWLNTAPIDHQIAVGRETENVAITRLTLRPALDDEGRIAGLVEIANLGLGPSNRMLRIAAATEEVLNTTVSLVPGEHKTVAFHMSRRAGLPARARLQPHDALGLDDEIAAGQAGDLMTRISLSGGCDRAIVVALNSLPGVEIVRLPSSTDLAVHCGPSHPPASSPLLWLHAAEERRPLTGQPYWDTGSGRFEKLLLSPDWLRTGTDKVDTKGEVLLHAPLGHGLIVRRWDQTQHTIEVHLDMSYPRFTRQTVYPLLITELVSAATGKRILDPIVTTERDPTDSIIVPSPLTIGARDGPQETSRLHPMHSMVDWLLLLALLIMLIELRELGVVAPPSVRLHPSRRG